MSKQKELNDLRAQEMELEASVLSMKKEIEKMTNKQQETLLYISQVNFISLFQLQDFAYSIANCFFRIWSGIERNIFGPI